jgi:hypothetical protein
MPAVKPGGCQPLPLRRHAGFVKRAAQRGSALQ